MIDVLPVSIITLSDEHLKEFSKCPYKFYMQDILKIRMNQKLTRQQTLQLTINKVIKEFYKLPVQSRHSLSVLKLIEKYWCHVTPSLFQSQMDYYTALAKVTDHLLTWLKDDNGSTPPLFLYEKQTKYIEELDLNISICFEVVDWSNDSYIIKKFIIEEDESFLKYFYSLLVVFADKAFHRLPEKIEIYGLMSGKKYTYYPAVTDIADSMEVLKVMKGVLVNPASYERTANPSHCVDCSFNSSCDKAEKNNTPKLLYI